MGDPLNGWSTYFQEISRLLENTSMESRLYFRKIGDDTDLLHYIRQPAEAEELEEYVSSLRELIDCIKMIYRKREEYQTLFFWIPK